MRFELSEAELKIMDFIWDNGGQATFKEMLEYFNNTLQKEWKKQTLRTFLVRLAGKKYLYIDKSNSKYKYYALKTREEHKNILSTNFLKKFFNGSVREFLSALSGNEKISVDSAESLKEFINEDDEDEL